MSSTSPKPNPIEKHVQAIHFYNCLSTSREIGSCISSMHAWQSLKRFGCIAENFTEENFVISFKIKNFAVKILQFCSKPALHLLGENILLSENFVNLAKLYKSYFKPCEMFLLYRSYCIVAPVHRTSLALG